MKSRGLIIGALVFFAIAVSSVTFAFWASGIIGNQDTATGTVTIGEGEEVSTTVTVEDVIENVNLVPLTYVGTNDVNLDFDVDWEGTGAEGATGTLSVTIDSVSLGTLSEAEINNMFTITVTAGEGAITAGTTKQVTVNVEFTNEPVDQAMYDQVANGSLVITFTFDVVAD